MKILSFGLILLSLSILSASCTKELRYSKESLYKKAQDIDPTVTFVMPRSINEGAHCRDYTAGCLSAHTIKVQNLELIAVEYMTEGEALYAAKKYKGFYLANWFLDDVTGEPQLESFVLKLEAKRP